MHVAGSRGLLTTQSTVSSWGADIASLGPNLLDGMRPDFFSRALFTSLVHHMSASAYQHRVINVVTHNVVSCASICPLQGQQSQVLGWIDG